MRHIADRESRNPSEWKVSPSPFRDLGKEANQADDYAEKHGAYRPADNRVGYCPVAVSSLDRGRDKVKELPDNRSGVINVRDDRAQDGKEKYCPVQTPLYAKDCEHDQC